MIPRTITTWQTNSWQDELVNLIRDPAELISLLELDLNQAESLKAACQDFPLKVPRAFVAKMRKGDLNDPLLLQVLPSAKELDTVAGYTNDPLKEVDTNPLSGLIHKYNGRVLLIISGNCAVNCRYCFRRHFPYSENRPGKEDWQAVIDYIQSDNTIHEVIFSGGDPLSASDKQLSWLASQINRIAHVQRLRIHTRLPIVLPDRITQTCIDWLVQPDLQTIVVLHANHANEIDGAIEEMVNKLRAVNITMLNQSVLLKGVNDSVASLKALSEKLFAAGILPYYLHLLDSVAGAAHFHVPQKMAVELYRSLQACLPGYMVPKLVKEVPAAQSKTLVL